jgi:hypothetical protein
VAWHSYIIELPPSFILFYGHAVLVSIDLMKKFIRAELVLLVIGGLFLWNTWVFGWLNHGAAGYTRMSISELNVLGQPYATFFSVTEGLSGLFLLVGAFGLIATIRKGGFMLLALILIGIIGALTVFDATHPVDCNQYQNSVCAAKAARGDISNTDKEHGVESIVTNYATVFLALILVAWVLIRKISKEDIAMVESAIVVILAMGIIISLVIRSRNIVFDSISQRVWNTLVSFDFLYVAYKVWLQENLRKSHS